MSPVSRADLANVEHRDKVDQGVQLVMKVELAFLDFVVKVDRREKRVSHVYLFLDLLVSLVIEVTRVTKEHQILVMQQPARQTMQDHEAIEVNMATKVNWDRREITDISDRKVKLVIWDTKAKRDCLDHLAQE